jgi:hypothetical protein
MVSLPVNQFLGAYDVVVIFMGGAAAWPACLAYHLLCRLAFGLTIPGCLVSRFIKRKFI